MPFKTQLTATEIGTWKGRAVWKLDTPMIYETDAGQTITVPAGLETDFASVPRVPIVYDLWGDRAHHEGVLHDYLYRYNSEPVVPKWKADALFLEAMKSRGAPWWVYLPMYRAVVAFGGPSYHMMSVRALYELEAKE